MRYLNKKASADQLAGLLALVQDYADGGAEALPKSKFNGQEGWFPSSKAQNKIRLEAFKPWQLRAYGFCRSYHGAQAFFITGVDPAKKRDRANQNILTAAGKLAAELNKVIG